MVIHFVKGLGYALFCQVIDGRKIMLEIYFSQQTQTQVDLKLRAPRCSYFTLFYNPTRILYLIHPLDPL